jgi:hypothetical protein
MHANWTTSDIAAAAAQILANPLSTMLSRWSRRRLFAIAFLRRCPSRSDVAAITAIGAILAAGGAR